MTRRMEEYAKGMLYVASALLLLGAAGIGAHLAFYQSEPIVIQLAEPVAAASNKKTDATGPGVDPMISKLAASRMSKTVVQSAPVRVKPPAPNLSILLRVKGIMDFGDPQSSEAIIESIRNNTTKSYKVKERVDGIETTVMKIDKVVTFLYDGKEIQMGVNSDVGIELPVAGSESAPVLTENKFVPKNP